MQRRNALKLLAGAAALPLLSSDALAFFRAVQTQAGQKTTLQTLTPAQNAVVETMSELIIPATDTPGAKAAHVSEFIDLILTDWAEADERKEFLDGLAEVDGRSRELFGKNFVDATAAQQNEIVRGLEDELVEAREQVQASRRGKKPLPKKTFYSMMKQLTLVGYYTSQIGQQEEVHYQIIPSAHEQCAPIATQENE